LFWSSWHRALGELAVDVLGSDAMVFEGEEMMLEQKLFLYTRSDTIYGGSNQVQRNILGERVLGLPKEPVL
jgi:alkylation response protein AidB-like acyl-CoA dehydrogenase